jgi:lysophospholipase L1-like esterase
MVMKRVARSVHVLLFIVVLIVSLVAPSRPAHADSDWDEVYVPHSSVVLAAFGTSPPVNRDISTEWSRLIKSKCSAATWASFSNAVENNGSWYVMNRPIAYYAEVSWTQNTSATFYFGDAWGTPDLFRPAYVGGMARFGLGPNGGVSCDTDIASAPLSATPITYAPIAYEPLFIHFPIAYPSEYEGEVIPTESPVARYVAMGDSFSSGEGNPPFEIETDEDGVNECHRSPQAYPRLLQAEQMLGLATFVTCSGATTSNILYGGVADGAWGEAPQVDALSADTEVVTITVGGNDVGFGEYATECLHPIDLTSGVCDEFTDIYDETMWKIENELGSKLVELYGELLEHAPNAEIYIAGYPHIAPYKDIEEPFNQNCGELYGEIPNNWGDARAAYELTTRLNDMIEEAITAANSHHSSDRLTFVPVDNGAFIGHDSCSSDSYFNGIVYPDMEYSVHPNAKGHTAYKNDLAGVMN